MVKITVEMEDGQKVTYEYEHAEIASDRRIGQDEEGNIFPTIFGRLSIKAWSGCKSFEGFRPNDGTKTMEAHTNISNVPKAKPAKDNDLGWVDVQ